MELKNLEKKENKTVEFQVESGADEFEKAVNAAYLKNKGQINIPGFRKGKAPRKVIEGMYGAEVFYQDALDELAETAFMFGAAKVEDKTVGAPAIVNVEVTENRTALFTFALELYPEVTLGEYKGLTATRTKKTVSDEDVLAELANVQKRNARKVTVEDRAAQMGDNVNIDFDGYLNGERFDGGKAEGYTLELGSGSFVPGFEEQVVGMTIGEEKDLDITFPENYAAELAGKAVVFKVKLNSITVDELPELDDEFAQDNDFDTLDAYKADVKENLQKRADEQAENAVRVELMDKALANLTVEIPQVMIDEKAEEIVRNYASQFGMPDRSVSYEQLKQMMGLNDEAMQQSIIPAAESQVKSEILLNAIVEAEGITSDEEETKAYAAKVAETVGAAAEDIEKYFGLEFIANENKKEKANAVIFDSAVITDAE